MDMILVKIFATALALSEVTTAPQAVKTHFDPVQDRAEVVQILRDGCAHMRQAFDIESINLDDLIATARGIGSGKLLTPESYATFTTTDLRGKTSAVPGCPACFEQSIGYTYGLGVVISGDWLLQDPLFSGESAVEAYLPSQDVAIAVAVTYQPAAFDTTTGAYSNQADQLWREIAVKVVPDNPPPIKKG